MFDRQIFPTIVTAILVVISFYWIVRLGKLAWFDPYKLEEILSERARNHLLNAYNPKYNWKTIVLMWRIFSLVATIALLAASIELLLGLVNLIL